jgi:DNA-binding MarR family transcriptional regulator
MVSTTIAVEAGPRPLLAYLLLHHRADAATLGATLGRDDAQVARSLDRLAGRGLVAAQDGQYEVVPARRTAVADYAEGALTLRALAGR